MKEQANDTVTVEKERDFSEAMIASVPGIFYVLDSMGSLVKWNDRFREVTGYTDVELAGMNALTFFDEDEQDKVLKRIGTVFVEGQATVEAEFRAKGGAKTPYFFTGARAVIDGEPYLVGVGVDVSDRVEAKRALSQSEKEHRSTLMNLAEAFFRTSIEDGTVLAHNLEFNRLLGFDPEEDLVGLTLPDFYADPEVRKAAVNEIYRRGFVKDFPVEARRRNGEVCHVQVNGRLVEDDTGRPKYLEGTFIDVTERVRAEQELRDSEQRYRAIFEAMGDGLVVGNLDGVIRDVNEAACRMHGYQRGELVGAHVTKLINEDEAPKADEFFRTVSSGDRYEAEGCGLRKDGMAINTEVRGVPFMLQGEPHLLAILRDITEKKKIEKALSESEERLVAVAEALPDLVFVIDEDGKYVQILTAQSDLLFVPAEALVGKRVDDLFPPETAALFMKLLDDAIHTGETQVLEYSLDVPAGTRQFEIRAATTRTVIDGKRAVVCVSRDITEGKQLQAQLAQSDRLSSMGMLAAGVAHEINNPLSYVLFNLESLSKDLCEPGELCQDFIDDMRDRFDDALLGVRRIREIVRGLGTFSRVEEDEVVSVDLVRVIDTALGMATNELKYRARVVKLYQQAPKVLASEGRLGQVFLNLIINAAHAIDEGDVENNELLVRTTVEGQEVSVEVRDTGRGIPPENQDRLFEPFFTTKKIGVGSGLGLAISRNIVEGYGGTITVESEPGAGTAFFVRLPVPDAAIDGQAETAGVSDVPPASGRLLVVDDEPMVRSSLRRMLREHVLEVAGSGAEAMDILKKDQGFDLILCDMMMSDVSGMELHQWLMEKYPEQARQLVFMTGGAFTPRTSEYLRQVDNLRIDKPFEELEVKKMVAELVLAAQKVGRGRG